MILILELENLNLVNKWKGQDTLIYYISLYSNLFQNENF